ncbi:MAG TPA: NADP-dependent oxidoreductase [Steroidobacteraceae bacterium]|nr:NADP-dependent oxidoreductase [Steroidobacteraceae bacterium]
MTATHRRIVLASRPGPTVTEEVFRLEDVPIPEVGAGQVLVRNHYLSLDPYMRARIDEAKSYAPTQSLGETMIGSTVGVVVASNTPAFAVGDSVLGRFGWQEYGVGDERSLSRIDTRVLPMSVYLGVVGMPGVTAWYGLSKICEPKAGETLVVSAASGAVGSVVGQLAKSAGCRVIGIAGGPEKCAYVVDELGLDACLDHREFSDARSMAEALGRAAPNGVDGVFENVGGACLDAALAHINPFGRVALCGVIAGFHGDPIPIHNVRNLLVMRVRLQGFIVSDHLEVWRQALAELQQGVAAGRIKYRETIAQGLESAPQAFLGMLAGRNFGKQLVKLV